MVTLLSDCYISSHGKSAISPVSYHYANDGQFNFSWSEGEFLIRVRHSTQDGEKDVKAGREEWIAEVKKEEEEEGLREAGLEEDEVSIHEINTCITIILLYLVFLLFPLFVYFLPSSF